MMAVRAHFRPEFINRLDEIIIFHPLSRDHIRDIVRIQLDRLVDRLRKRAGIRLETTSEAEDLLAEEGYDPQYGARPLKRVIQRMVENPLAMDILEGRFREGDLIEARREGCGLAFSKKEGVFEAA
jgi:ATP-dependent Clp protease ATP-binding subunit ClpB